MREKFENLFGDILFSKSSLKEPKYMSEKEKKEQEALKKFLDGFRTPKR